MTKIFISYRREDSQHQADRLHAVLKREAPRSSVFIDIDNIPVGIDFVEHLDRQVAQCDVLLALIGPDWLSAAEGAGGRRLDDSKDFVRIEIASALKRGIPVAPVLLDGAVMPKENQLPDDLRPLARRQGAEIRRSTFDDDAGRMIRSLGLDGASNSTATRKSLLMGGGIMAPIAMGAVVLGVGAWLLVADPFKWRGGSPPDADGAPASNSSAGLAAPTAKVSSPVGTEGAERAFAAAASEGPVASRVFRDCADCPEMVALPSGSFTMGSRNSEKGRYLEEGPQHPVDIAYQLAAGKSEVTVRQYLACVADGACKQPEWRDPDTSAYNKDSYAALGPALEAPDNPVVGVSWNDAQDYAAWLSKRTGLSYRLLTESEWEYAARAGTQTAYSFGDVITHDLANYDGGPETTTIAGKYPANTFGLYDMHGNAAEWVADCHVGAYSGQSSDGGAIALCGTSAARMFRGGSWLSEPLKLRSASRNWLEPAMRTSILGFRIARRK